MPDKLEERIRARAHKIWEEEGRPEGRAADHWEKARILVAIEDDRTSLVPVEQPAGESAEVMENLGELPTVETDEGDRQQYPSRKAEMQIANAEPVAPEQTHTRRSPLDVFWDVWRLPGGKRAER